MIFILFFFATVLFYYYKFIFLLYYITVTEYSELIFITVFIANILYCDILFIILLWFSFILLLLLLSRWRIDRGAVVSYLLRVIVRSGRSSLMGQNTYLLASSSHRLAKVCMHAYACMHACKK